METISTIQDVVPLASAVIGGAIAIIATVIAARSSHRHNLHRDHIKTRMEKSEELYDLLLRVDQESALWYNTLDDGKYGRLKDGIRVNEHERHRIQLLCDIYLPSRAGQAKELLDAHTEFGVYFFYRMGLANDSKHVDDNLVESEKEAYKSLMAKSEQLRKDIARDLTMTQ